MEVCGKIIHLPSPGTTNLPRTGTSSTQYPWIFSERYRVHTITAKGAIVKIFCHILSCLFLPVVSYFCTLRPEHRGGCHGTASHQKTSRATRQWPFFLPCAPPNDLDHSSQSPGTGALTRRYDPTGAGVSHQQGLIPGPRRAQWHQQV